MSQGPQSDRRNVAADIRRIVGDKLGVDAKDVKPESGFVDDLGADSLGLVELTLAIEEAFEIDIPQEVAERISTVQDAIDFVEANIE